MAGVIFRGLLQQAAAGGGGGLPGAHRYWRLNIARNVSGVSTVIAIPEVELYTARFGVNQCVGGTAAASSTLNGGTPASNAVDKSGDESSVWAGASYLNEWWSYDFGVGNDKEIVEIGMLGRGLTAAEPLQMPYDFDVQYSDDNSSWTTAWSEAAVSWPRYECHRFTHPSAPSASRFGTGSYFDAYAYWRLAMHTDSNVCALAEIEMRASLGGADQCAGGTPTATTTFGGQVASLAFDNNSATYWAATAKYGGMTYQFAAPVTVAQLSLTARNDASAYVQAPLGVWVQFSTNGTDWTTAWFANGLSWTQGSTNTPSDPDFL
jgi:hypothetical protein